MILTTQCNAVTTHKELSREPPHIDIVVLETVLVLKAGILTFSAWPVVNDHHLLYIVRWGTFQVIPCLTTRAIQGYSFTPVVCPPTTRLSSSLKMSSCSDVFLIKILTSIFKPRYLLPILRHRSGSRTLVRAGRLTSRTSRTSRTSQTSRTSRARSLVGYGGKGWVKMMPKMGWWVRVD